MPELSELQKLNRTVEMMYQVLKSGQTPADQKAAAKAQKEAADAQKAAANAQKKKAERDKKPKEKKETKKPTTWTQLKGLFTGTFKDVQKFGSQTNKNLITWGGLGKTIKDSVVNWFKNTMKTNTLLGRTFRFGAALWTNVFQGMYNKFKDVFSELGGQIREVLGPGIMAIYDTVKKSIKGAFSFVGGVFKSVFAFGKKVKPEDKMRNKLLRGILNVLKKTKKDKDKDQKAGFLSKLSGGGLFGGLLKSGPMIIAAIIGFAILLWSIYNFISGFLSVDSDQWSEKIRGGLKNMYMKLYKIPSMILEWLMHDVFGFEWAEGLSDKIMNFISGAIDYVVDLMIRPISDFFQAFFQTEGTFVERITAAFNAMMVAIFEGVQKWAPTLIKFFTDMWMGVWEIVEGLFPGLADGIAGIFSGIMNMFENLMLDLNELTFGLVGPDAEKKVAENLRAVVSDNKITDAEVERMRSQLELEDVDKEMLRSSLEKLAAAQAAGDTEAANKIIQSLAEMRGADNTQERQEIWNEVDNVQLTMANSDANF
jgi:hypothetical protein